MRHLLFIFLLFLVTGFSQAKTFSPLSSAATFSPSPENPLPQAHLIISRVWENMSFEKLSLEGRLRVSKTEQSTPTSPIQSTHPFILHTSPKKMVYAFKKKPLQISIEFQKKRPLIKTRTKEKEEWRVLPQKDYSQYILDSDITYEEMALDFLYWKNMKCLRKKRIKTLNCYELSSEEIKPPHRKSKFWIALAHFTLLRSDIYNAKNEHIKRIEINSVMKIGNVYTIKQMKISSMIPRRNISSSRTYLEILGREKK